MEYNLNKGTVLDMAATMRKAVPGMKTSASLELISKMFKQPNWDTFSGILNKADNTAAVIENKWKNDYGWVKQAPVLDKPVMIFFNANSDNDSEYPLWTSVELDQSLLDKIIELQTQCLRSGSNEIVVEWPADFDVNDQSSNYHAADLIVGSNSLQFKALMRRYDYSVESGWVEISRLLDAMAKPGSKDDDYIWLDNNLIMSRVDPVDLAKTLYDNEVIEVDEEVIDAL
ncbi:hypothetical protein [Comamonas thiooxydans]|uniref:hypothetical protein n=1 Tax=Comamonas thiooxydans TaxID=363952 RepID=UPI000B41D6AA|nr:hypothetical protein [Comamonas thiooxydans]